MNTSTATQTNLVHRVVEAWGNELKGPIANGEDLSTALSVLAAQRPERREQLGRAQAAIRALAGTAAGDAYLSGLAKTLQSGREIVGEASHAVFSGPSLDNQALAGRTLANSPAVLSRQAAGDAELPFLAATTPPYSRNAEVVKELKEAGWKDLPVAFSSELAELVDARMPKGFLTVEQTTSGHARPGNCTGSESVPDRTPAYTRALKLLRALAATASKTELGQFPLATAPAVIRRRSSASSTITGSKSNFSEYERLAASKPRSPEQVLADLQAGAKTEGIHLIMQGLLNLQHPAEIRSFVDYALANARELMGLEGDFMTDEQARKRATETLPIWVGRAAPDVQPIRDAWNKAIDRYR